ncbi:hypothetical protein Tco_1290244 [Tanacetum coccineum]
MLSASLWAFWHRCGLESPECDSDLSRLILEKTLGVGSRFLDMLRECLDLRLLLGSPFKFGVLDSEFCDASWIFEFLLEHPLKLRWAFTPLSLSLYAFSW